MSMELNEALYDRFCKMIMAQTQAAALAALNEQWRWVDVYPALEWIDTYPYWESIENINRYKNGSK